MDVLETTLVSLKSIPYDLDYFSIRQFIVNAIA
jgi:hypothetical protein